MVEEIKKSSTTKTMTEKEKEKAKLAAQKQKEKEKAKLAAQKQKEKEKAKLAAQKQKEKEKAKLAAQKQKEKEKAKLAAQKEKAKQTTSKTSTSKTTSNTSAVKKSTSTNKTNPTKKVEKVEVVEKIEVSEKEIVKRDLNQLFDLKKKNIDDLPKNEDGVLADEKPSDHVAILRKKMEAQRKLKENANPLEKTLVEESEPTDGNDLLNSKIKQLEETIAMLTDEVKDKDALINKQDLEIKDKSDQIIILTNSIVSKTNEADLVKELELLKKENENLKIELEEQIKENAVVKTEMKVEEQPTENRVDINSPDVQEIIAQGDILLRIKLLDQRIQEKEAKIQLFEDELNKLTEADIQTSDFKQEIKVLRENRRSFVNSTNDRLTELTKLISKDEEKLNKRKAEYNAKGEEIKQFDKELKEKKLTIAQKEKEMKVRSRLVAEYDSLAIKINEIEDYFKKTILQYKNELASAEKKVEELNSYENQLIESNLQKIREQRTLSNKDYKDDVETRSGLLVELDKLTQIYEEMKNNNLATEEETENVELNALKKEYAKLAGKINLIEVRYNERVNVEEVLRTIDPDVSSYLKAFEEREKLLFDINELNNKINDEKCDNKEHLELLINDYQSRVNYLEVIIKKNEDHEKVVFYKQLLKSMAEIKEKEADIRAKAKLLKSQIDAMDNVE